MSLLDRMVRPGGLELPTFWFEAVRTTLPNLARGVASRTDSASWDIPANHFLFHLSPFTSHLPLLSAICVTFS